MSLLGSLFGEEAALGWYTDKNASNKGKTIGYRRVSGKVGLTDNENGVRGAWVEKRVALFKKLLGNNYKIALLSQPTDQTEAEGVEFSNVYKPVDVLILEFGGTNIQFYKKYWDVTVEMINEHKGRIIFINDDPDLSFLWELLPNEDWSRWTIAANATNTSEVAKTLKVPDGARVVDYPMDAGMLCNAFHPGKMKKVVYIGRPNGRAKYFRKFLLSPELIIAGKKGEWESEWGDLVEVIPNPAQKDRKQFYTDYAGCLAVYDTKHMNCGWRTGRAYHALYAGIPVCAPPGNDGLRWTYTVETASDITDFANLSAEVRKKIWLQQKESALSSTVDLIKL